jgi:hypothetical protein
MRSFIICFPPQILVEWSNQGVAEKLCSRIKVSQHVQWHCFHETAEDNRGQMFFKKWQELTAGLITPLVQNRFSPSEHNILLHYCIPRVVLLRYHLKVNNVPEQFIVLHVLKNSPPWPFISVKLRIFVVFYVHFWCSFHILCMGWQMDTVVVSVVRRTTGSQYDVIWCTI